MSTDTQQVVQKLWSYCNILRDDGLSYGDYVEQLTYLLFLKMAHERTGPPWNEKSVVPAGFDWPSLLAKDGDALETHYRHVLEDLGKRPGMLGLIFRKAQNKVQDPAKLRRLIADLIDRESWLSLDADVKGDAYEGLLEKNAQDTKNGAGQYFTPRALIRAIVDVVRLCAMNLLLHGIGPSGDEAPPPIEREDSLAKTPSRHFDVVLTNPPFGRKPASETPWTKQLWIYDLRTNQHFTLKTRPLQRADLDEFVACYRAGARPERVPTWSLEAPDGRWRAFGYDELILRDKCSLDLFWLKDESLEASENLPDPDVIAAEIADDLRAALEQFEEVALDLGSARPGASALPERASGPD